MLDGQQRRGVVLSQLVTVLVVGHERQVLFQVITGSGAFPRSINPEDRSIGIAVELAYLVNVAIGFTRGKGGGTNLGTYLGE